MAGDKFDDVDAVGSVLEACAIDSLELHDEELATDVGGSSFKDFLKYKSITITIFKFILNCHFKVITCTDRPQRYSAALLCTL